MNDLGFSLADRQILVAGGTRGVGKAISLQFARAGAKVLANYVRDDAAAEALRREAGEAGLGVEVVRADLTSAKGMEALVERVQTELPRVSGLVYAAATGVHRSIEELSLRHFDWTFALNVRAFFDLTQRILARFQPGSTILAISSAGAVRAGHLYGLVGSSKGALESLARHMARELAPRGIRVNILAPGTVATEVWNVLPDSAARLREAAERSPLHRLVTLDEVARAAQFLCSDAANGIVGHTLVVDGGYRIVE